MITRLNQWKTMVKHISSNCRCKFDDRKYNSKQKWSDDKNLCENKKNNENNRIEHRTYDMQRKFCLES